MLSNLTWFAMTIVRKIPCVVPPAWEGIALYTPHTWILSPNNKRADFTEGPGCCQVPTETKYQEGYGLDVQFKGLEKGFSIVFEGRRCI